MMETKKKKKKENKGATKKSKKKKTKKKGNGKKTKKNSKNLLGLILGILLFGVLGWGVYNLFISFKEYTTIEIGNRDRIYAEEDKILRDFYLFIDHTRSVSRADKNEIKKIVKNKIIDNLGPGDQIICYQISSQYQQSEDKQFTNINDLITVPQNSLRRDTANFSVDFRKKLSQAWNRWNESSDMRDEWKERIDKLESPPGNKSDYFGAIKEIEKDINRSLKKDNGKEIFLIMIGDLNNTREPDSMYNSIIKNNKLNHVNFWLVYPPTSEEPTPSKEKIWKKYFPGYKLEFISLDQFTKEFPECEVPKFK